jgi:hypothetical protein
VLHVDGFAGFNDIYRARGADGTHHVILGLVIDGVGREGRLGLQLLEHDLLRVAGLTPFRRDVDHHGLAAA